MGMTRNQEKAMFAGMNDSSGKRQRLSDGLQDVRQVKSVNKNNKFKIKDIKYTNSKTSLNNNDIDIINELNNNKYAKKLGLKINKGQNVSFVSHNDIEPSTTIFKSNIWKLNSDDFKYKPMNFNDKEDIENIKEIIMVSEILRVDKNNNNIIIHLIMEETPY